MRARPKDLFWLVAFAFVVISLAGLSIHGSIHQQNKAKSNGPRNESSKIERPITPDERIANYTEALAYLTAVLSFVSIIQLGFLLRADRTARLSADAAKQAADVIPTLERAFIYVDEIRIGKDIINISDGALYLQKEQSQWKIEISIINCGRTPANIFNFIGFAEIRSSDPPTVDETLQAATYKPSASRIIIIIAANARGKLPATHTVSGLGFADMDRFRNRDISLYVWGVIRYADIFGFVHPTEFCLRMIQIGSDGVGEFVPIGPTERNQST